MTIRKWFKRPAYGRAQLLGDFSGGVIAALIALPYGLAMASAMGLPPVLGLFTSILTSPITALMGRNPMLIGGTGSATVPFISAAVREQGIGGAAKVAVVASVIMMGFCVMRLGRYVARVPNPVVTGFSCGVGGLMLFSQLDIILGVAGPLTRTAGSALMQLSAAIDLIPQARLGPLVIGLTVIIAASLVARWYPRAPAPLIGALLAIGAAKGLGFHESEIGTLPTSLPRFAGFSWAPHDIYTVLPSAFALAFVTALNILITSRVVDHFRGRHKHMKPSDADAELGAYGIANVCAGVFGAPLSVGIPARSIAAIRCGGTTRMSNLFHAGLLILMLQFGSDFIGHIPMAALAGVTAWMGIRLLDWSAWRRIPTMRRVDAAAFLGTALSVVALNAVAAVAIGCSFYGLHAFYRKFSRPAEQIPDLQVH